MKNGKLIFEVVESNPEGIGASVVKFSLSSKREYFSKIDGISTVCFIATNGVTIKLHGGDLYTKNDELYLHQGLYTSPKSVALTCRIPSESIQRMHDAVREFNQNDGVCCVKRTIELDLLHYFEDREVFELKVLKQTHRSSYFWYNRSDNRLQNIFSANNFNLQSVSSPAWSDNNLYLRGEDSSCDDANFMIPKKYYDKFLDLIDMYNQDGLF